MLSFRGPVSAPPLHHRRTGAAAPRSRPC